jgi:hypothetical protein
MVKNIVFTRIATHLHSFLILPLRNSLYHKHLRHVVYNLRIKTALYTPKDFLIIFESKVLFFALYVKFKTGQNTLDHVSDM